MKRGQMVAGAPAGGITMEQANKKFTIAGQFVKEKEFWIKTFSGELANASIPSSSQNEKEVGNERAEESFTLAPEICERLLFICNRHLNQKTSSI